MNTTDFLTALMINKKALNWNDHKVCRALINTLDTEELLRLKADGVPDWHTDKYIDERLSGQPRKKDKTPHYEGWRKCLDHITCRRIGKVVSARKEIHTTFPYLEWKAQRTILEAFITGPTQIDRLWALKQLRDDWAIVGDCRGKERKHWEDVIYEVWQTYHDRYAASIVGRYLPYSVIADNEEILIKEVGYRRVALRLGVNPDYPIIRQKMPSNIDYLYVMASLKRPVDSETLDFITAEVLLNLTRFEEAPFILPHRIPASIFSTSNVGLLLWCLGQLGHADRIQDLYKKDLALLQAVHRQCPDDTDDDFWPTMRSLIPQYFPILKDYPQQNQGLTPKDYTNPSQLFDNTMFRMAETAAPPMTTPIEENSPEDTATPLLTELFEEGYPDLKRLIDDLQLKPV